MKYSVSEDGVQALNRMASAICDAIEGITTNTANLQNVSDEYSDTIGPHKSSLDAALSNIADNVSQSINPASDVAE